MECDTNSSHSPSPSIPRCNPKLLAWTKYPRKNVQLYTFKKINGHIENIYTSHGNESKTSTRQSPK